MRSWTLRRKRPSRSTRCWPSAGEDDVRFGAPYVEGASVQAKVVKHGKGEKIRIIKHKAKKGYRKRQGHRQPYTKLTIEKINV